MDTGAQQKGVKWPKLLLLIFFFNRRGGLSKFKTILYIFKNHNFFSVFYRSLLFISDEHILSEVFTRY